jgi:hypothetical protein
MRTVGFPEFLAVVGVAPWLLAAWAVWKFYGLFSRVAQELSEIKTILRDGAGRTNAGM